MFTILARELSKNHIVKQTIIENSDYTVTRTHKVFEALEKVCHEFDLSVPIWLDNNISDFKKHSRCRFYQDNFIDEIDFDYLDFQVTEEDY